MISQVLSRMTRSVVLTETNFKTYLPSCAVTRSSPDLTQHYVSHSENQRFQVSARKHDLIIGIEQFRRPELACKALDDLISIRLLPAENDLWIEKACITRIWITVSLPAADHPEEMLHNILNIVRKEAGKPFPSLSTHAAQMVTSGDLFVLGLID